MSIENLDELPSDRNLVESILNPAVFSMIKKNRRKTIANNFINAIRINNQVSIENFLADKDIQSEKRKKTISSEAIKSALENDNTDLALSLKSQGFKVSGSLFLSVISERNVKVLNGLLKLGIYSQDRLHAYLWYLVHEGFEQLASELINTNSELQEYSGMETMNPEGLLVNPTLAEAALNEAFISGCDELTEKLALKNLFLIKPNNIELALENNCIGFLKVVSSKDLIETNKSITRFQPENLSSDNIPQKKMSQAYILEFLDFYLQKSNFEIIFKIIHWPEAEHYPEIMKILIENDLELIAKEYIKIFEKETTSKDFYFAFEKGQFNLCLAMLSIGVSRLSLNNIDFQKRLIELIVNPEQCLLCIELLAEIDEKDWIPEITKLLCTNLQSFAKKTDSILYCAKPILYCVKVIEFLSDVSTRDYEYRAKCLAVAELYKELALNLQDQIKGEDDLKYFMTHEDSNGNSALNLIAKNEFIELLQNEDVGTIIEKFWAGATHARSIFEASTIYMSVHSALNNPDVAIFLKRMQKNRNYSFQYEQWVDSCSFRFFGQGLSAAFLVLIYQILIYRTFQLTDLYAIGEHGETKGYFRLVQAWIFGILMEQILQVVYVSLKQKPSLLNPWKFLDIITFVLMILISSDISGGYVNKRFSDSEKDDLAPGIILSLLMFIIWIRFASIVIVTKTFGQFLRIIYHMIGETLNFFIILLSLFICAAGVFTAIFYNSNPKFISFDISLRTVFADAMGGFDLTNYTSNLALGGSFEAFYLMISNVVLLNLLIAIISNVYETLVARVESEHRNVIISYIEKYQWDPKYGFLIYLPSPLSSLVVLFCPFVIWGSKEPEKWNSRICKGFFLVYVAGLLFVFNLIGIVYSVPLYFKGFLIYPMQENAKVEDQDQTDAINYKHSKFNLLGKAMVWFFIGYPLIIWALIRDAYDFVSIIYQESQNSEESPESLKYDTFLTSNFIKNLQLTLENIQQEEINTQQLLEAWKLFDDNDHIENNLERKLRIDEVEEFFKQFLLSHKKQIINVQLIRKMLPRVKGDVYDADYIDHARYLNIAGLNKGIRIFHSNIGALNISGVTIPKPEPDNTFDMERINNLNNSIKELDELYLKLRRYSNRLVNNRKGP